MQTRAVELDRYIHKDEKCSLTSATGRTARRNNTAPPRPKGKGTLVRARVVHAHEATDSEEKAAPAPRKVTTQPRLQA